MAELLAIEIPGGHGRMWAEKTEAGKVLVHRHASRGGVRNVIENYDSIGPDGRSELKALTDEIAIHILKQVASGVPYSSAFIIETNAPEPVLDMRKTEAEHRWTSSGIKFWRHAEQMTAYQNGGGHTVVSSHISPEGACNLRCPYCSVTYRDTHSRIDYAVIEKYVTDLQSRGLKAIILTGGGEPTIYPKFNELVQWLKFDRQLLVALITNGTQANRIADKTWKAFSWVRVSINVFDGWEQKIKIPYEILDKDCVVGCSMVYTSEHQSTTEKFTGRMDILRRAAKVADNVGASYCRIQPNCILDKRALMLQHKALDYDLQELGDKRFFHQHKDHLTPKAHTCHQAHFRPYLSEEKFQGTGQPGTVLPCDSVCLVDAYQYFAQEYHICHASHVLDFLDGKLKMKFDPTKRCSGCVFSRTVDMLDDWKNNGVERFGEFTEPLVHEEFV